MTEIRLTRVRLVICIGTTSVWIDRQSDDVPEMAMHRDLLPILVGLVVVLLIGAAVLTLL